LGLIQSWNLRFTVDTVMEPAFHGSCALRTTELEPVYAYPDITTGAARNGQLVRVTSSRGAPDRPDRQGEL
jgi:hypothetical protein